MKVCICMCTIIVVYDQFAMYKEIVRRVHQAYENNFNAALMFCDLIDNKGNELNQLERS